MSRIREEKRAPPSLAVGSPCPPPSPSLVQRQRQLVLGGNRQGGQNSDGILPVVVVVNDDRSEAPRSGAPHTCSILSRVSSLPWKLPNLGTNLLRRLALSSFSLGGLRGDLISEWERRP